MSLRILFVDDDLFYSECYVDELRRVGMVVDTATNGADALDAIQARSYDAFVLDILMPWADPLSASATLDDPADTESHTGSEFGGVVLAREIRGVRKLKVPIVYLTIVSEQAVYSVLEAFDSRLGNLTTVLIKPCTAEKLVAAVEAAVEGLAERNS